jgi:ATP-binding cassette subfamily F protein 3
MNDPQTYEQPEKALKLNARYREVEDWAEHLMERMAEIEQEMEAISGEGGLDEE